MNNDQLEKAEELDKGIKRVKQCLANLDADYRNAYSLPQDLYDSHKAQIKEWLESELKRLQNEFDSI